jgi:uncharacterized protein (TIGR00266 family)
MDAQIVGTTMPVLEVALNPGEVVFSESGELSWMTASIQMRTSTQAGGGGGIGGVFKRAIAGGSIFMTEYTAQGQPGMVAFAAKLPGTIFPVDVAPQPGMTFMAHRHGFLCGMQGVELGIGFQQGLGAGIFGGDGFILQKIHGQGRAWVELSGEIVTFDLQQGEVMRVHPGHVGLFQDTVQFGITTVPGIKNKIFGGDGFFLAQLQGPGRVWLQSMTMPILAHSIGEYLKGQTAEAGVAGGAAGGLMGGLLGGGRPF